MAVDKVTFDSGLKAEDVEASLDALMRHPRVIGAMRNASSGQSAEIGLIAQTKKTFYVDTGPVVPGFTPAFVVKGGWAEGTLTPAKAAAGLAPGEQGAAMIVDLGRVGDAATFFRHMLTKLGPIMIAPRFSPDLWRSVPFIAADRTALELAATPFSGEKVAVCVIDMGCDFAHRNFRTKADPSKTRIKLLAVMDKFGSAKEYGSLLGIPPVDDLDHMISQANPYAKYDPQDPKHHVIPPGEDGTHGTVVLDILGGNGSGTGVAGVAPEADLYFIQIYVSTDKARRYIDGTQLLWALKYAKTKIGAQSAVFNVSLGTNEGPHDPFDHSPSAPAWNTLINGMFDKVPGKCLVVSAGNNYQAGLHASGKAAQNAPATFDVMVAAGDRTPNPFTFWFDKGGSASVSVRTMLADYKDAPNNYQGVWQNPGILVDDLQRDSGSLGDVVKVSPSGALHQISASVTPPLQRGAPDLTDRDKWEIWRFEVTSDASPAAPTLVDAWMERDDLDQAGFVTPEMPPGQSANADVDPVGSLNGLAAGVDGAIAVGAIGAATYMPDTPVIGPGLGRAVAFSSAGPTRLAYDPGGKRVRRLRPDVAAPGEGISAARSCADPVALHTGFEKAPTTVMSGTSMSAAYVTGLIALYYQKHVLDLVQADSATIRAALTETARPEEEGSALRWDAQRGYGCVDAVAFLKK